MSIYVTYEVLPIFVSVFWHEELSSQVNNLATSGYVLIPLSMFVNWRVWCSFHPGKDSKNTRLRLGKDQTLCYYWY